MTNFHAFMWLGTEAIWQLNFPGFPDKMNWILTIVSATLLLHCSGKHLLTYLLASDLHVSWEKMPLHWPKRPSPVHSYLYGNIGPKLNDFGKKRVWGSGHLYGFMRDFHHILHTKRTKLQVMQALTHPQQTTNILVFCDQIFKLQKLQKLFVIGEHGPFTVLE